MILYLLGTGIGAYKQGGRITVWQDKKLVQTISIRTVEAVVVGRNAQLSTQLIMALLNQGSLIFYVNRRGTMVGTLGDTRGAIRSLFRQVDAFRDSQVTVPLARYIVERKIKAQQEVMKYYVKKMSYSEDQINPKAMDSILEQAKRVITLEALRGVEGIAAREYFNCFGLFLRDGWTWEGRRKHPSVDPVNAILSYSYAFLEREVRLCLLGQGYDERIGVLHSNNGRKDSLVYDIMDLFRQPISDRIVLKVLNKQILNESNFVKEEKDRACYLTDEGQRKWVKHYEEWMLAESGYFAGKTPRAWIQDEVKEFLTEAKRTMLEVGYES